MVTPRSHGPEVQSRRNGIASVTIYMQGSFQQRGGWPGETLNKKMRVGCWRKICVDGSGQAPCVCRQDDFRRQSRVVRYPD
jgi:hypothetical protein